MPHSLVNLYFVLLYFKCAIRVLSLRLIVILSYCIHELVLNPLKTCEI